MARETTEQRRNNVVTDSENVKYLDNLVTSGVSRNKLMDVL